MGILFGGWAKEQEDEVNDVFGGDWSAYKRHIENNKVNRVIETMEYSTSEPKVTVGDLICQWDNNSKKPENEFFIQKIVEGKIIGRYIDGRHDNVSEKYRRKEYRKLCSIIEKI